MTKAFVLQEVGYQYNDEYYYRADDEGGVPQKVFLNKEKAKTAALELTAESSHFKGKYATPFDHLSYDDVDNEMFGKLNDHLIEIFGAKVPKVTEDEFYSWGVPKDATLEQRIKLAVLIEELFSLVFYEVIEVELEE